MLIFIGVLHAGLTPHDELIEIIESFNPSQLLVEITQNDIESNNVEKYPDEMQATLAWALNNHVQVGGFDSSIKTLKENVFEQDLKLLDEEQTETTSKYDWKDFNKAEFDHILETETWQKIVDKTKDNERNLEMAHNITRSTEVNASDVTVIVTGAGHIPFFATQCPGAQFPLR